MLRILKSVLKRLRSISFIIDIVFIPVTMLGALWFRAAKFMELKNLPFTKRILLKIGVFPIVKHYYEIQFDYSTMNFCKDRKLPFIDFNTEAQLKFISQFQYQQELKRIPLKKDKEDRYFYHNTSFQSGDAELFYSIIRQYNPKKIIEVGSGFSTLMALEALNVNNSECQITCIEPYEMPWLDRLNIDLIRKKVEDVDLSLFKQLDKNDILFIDSSHVIRPQGDVIFEIFNILPTLKSGVLIHFHDIFSPSDYPKDWLVDEFRFWNEQYLLEAFLAYNNNFSIIAAMHYLKSNYFNELSQVFPVIGSEPERNPGSLWLVKN